MLQPKVYVRYKMSVLLYTSFNTFFAITRIYKQATKIMLEFQHYIYTASRTIFYLPKHHKSGKRYEGAHIKLNKVIIFHDLFSCIVEAAQNTEY